MDEFLTATVSGVSQGSVYALLALGFVILYSGTGVISFAQPVIMTFGAFFASALAVDNGVPFVLAVVLAILGSAILGASLERLAMRPMVGKPVFSAVMVTIGLFIALQVIVADLIGSAQRRVGDPWGLDRLDAGGVTIYHSDIAKVLIAIVAVALLAYFFTRTRTGLALRATSLDQETALAQGIPVGRMFMIAWGIAGALAAVAGILVGTGAGGFDQTTTLLALKALPVIILGGLDSVRGAIVGGIIIGLSEAYTKVYQPEHAAWLGANFDQVVPYVVMLIVLLVRPYGLFGTPEVHRV